MFTGAICGKPARSFFTISNHRRGRCGAAAIALAAAATLCGPAPASADISGFSTFAPINSNGLPAGDTAVGYSANGSSFEITDANNGESVSGFTTNQVNIPTSFVVNFTLQGTGTADGMAFVIQSSGNNALGGGGGSVGYYGISSSVGIQLEGYSNSGGVSTNGAGINLLGAGGTIFSGNPINYTLTYTSDPTTHIGSYSLTGVDSVNPNDSISAGGSKINIQSAIGGTSAYIGFTGATGGLNATQVISNFTFHDTSALKLSYSPIAFSSGFNQDMVLEAAAAGKSNATSYITASMDQGTVNLNNNVWYEQGYNPSAPTTGLPPSGSRFTSQADSIHVFQMQNYNGSNAVLVGNSGGANSTLTLTTPQAFTALSVLSATGNGADNIDLVINYADSAPATTISHVVSPDWFNGGAVAWDANGRAVPTATGGSSFNAVNSGNPNLFQTDVLLPDTTDPISSITINADGGGGHTAVFAISGSVTVLGTLVYTGIDPSNASNDGNFDNGLSKTFSTSGTATAFTNGAAVIFDDSATGTHTVTVGSAGVLPSALTFNNNTSNYTLAAGGGVIGGGGTLTVNGTGTVTILNTNTFTGQTTLNAGTLVIGSGGSIASGNVLINPGATFTVAAGGQQVTTPVGIIDNGIANFNAASQIIGGLTGSGVVNLNGGAVTAGIGTNFNGSFGGTGGSLAYNTGSITVNTPSALAGLTKGLTVGGAISSSASLIINDNSGTAGTGAFVTLGTNGSLVTPANTNGAYAGNIVLNNPTGSIVAAPAISGGGQVAGVGQTTFTVTGNISGTGPVAFATMNNSTVVLSGTNTYSGETIISANDTATYNKVTLMAGANNTLSPNSGININGGGAAGSVLELNGYNQSVAYLTGGYNPASQITNNGGPNVTLTINNGNTATGAATFYGQITQGGNGSMALLKAGAGTQILGGANGYSGGTTVTGGTLVASNTTALGYGPVTLSGGTLNLATPAGTNIVSGVSGFKLTQAPGATGDPATVSGNTLTLTDGTASAGNAAFTTNPVAVGSAAGFYASFVYNSSAGTAAGTTADGITFTVQNDPRGNSAVGGTGGALGYGPNNNGSSIAQSGSVQFNIYGNPTVGTAFATNGSVPTDIGTGALNLYDGNPKQITLIYNAAAQTLTESIFENSSNQFAIVYPNVNFSSILNGSSSAYVGFTGGTGAVSATQTVSNFSFGALVYTPTSIGNPITVTQTSSPSVLNLPSSGTNTLTSIGSLTINPGAVLKLTSTGGSGTNFHSILTTSSLTFVTGPGSTYTGLLDIGKNDLDLTGTTLSTVTGYVQSGFNYAGGGKWNGPGITSGGAAANTNHLTAVGVISNNGNGNGQLYGSGQPLGLFDGSNPGSSDILVKYTYFGDANLDGKVDGSDYSLIDAGYSSHGSLTGWYNGDFNYDGVVDGSDYTLIDNAFNNQGLSQTASLTAQIATVTDQVAPAAVPEPASLAVAGFAAAGLFARRRRR